MSSHEDTKPDPSLSAIAARRVRFSRRDLLRRGVASMPAILTLHSGAALARTSNLISAAPPDTIDELGRTLCLDTNSVYPADEYNDIYDLGENPPRAVINIISDREYHTEKNRGSAIASKATVCEGGQPYWYNENDGTGWHPIELPYRGVVVSSGSMLSLAEHIEDHLY